ncbi:Anthranilate phosphoribosyltransferase [uncultured archaeon]|nr:Anthranilate phosphoribosyltransferase [uncultured archaeon]
MDIIRKLSAGENLPENEAGEAMEGMISGKLSPAQAAGILVALRMKGETVQEITAFARVMRQHAVRIHPKADGLVDTCGTGGDSSHTFNVSTTAAIVAAGAGASVAKHGNRSVSSSCGSADVLEQLGVGILRPPQVEKCIEEVGFGFMFAPYFHPAMKNVGPVRKELGIRTVFNILGPLTNPAGAQSQLLGVYDAAMARKMADALNSLGTAHALVVHSDGIDEIGLGATKVCEVKNGKVEEYGIDAKEFGFASHAIPKAKSREEGAKILLDALSGSDGAARDVALLNAGAAIYVAGKVSSIAAGVASAQQSIDSGKAMDVLEKLRKFEGA